MQLFLLVSILMGFISVSFASEIQRDFRGAESVLKTAIQIDAFPGCAVAIGNESGVQWSAGLGHFTYEKEQPVTTNTIYDLASLTKVIGTTSVYMRLSELKQIDLLAPVKNYLPEFVLAATNSIEKAQREQVTLEHLLTHTSGLAGWKPLYKSTVGYSNLLEAIYQTPLEAEPGTRFRYSDLGMILLGEIAARVGGKPLPALEEELVFKPLKMDQTLRNPAKAMIHQIPPTERWPEGETFVHGIVHDENARAGDGITGHAGLFSTANDLSKLAVELLLGLEGRSKLFSQDVVKEFTRKRGQMRRGLGWGILSQSTGSQFALSENTFGHAGFTGTSIWIDPERKLFLILLTNRVHPTRENNRIGRVRSDLAESVVRAWDSSAP